jgi:hypothetical protein
MSLEQRIQEAKEAKQAPKLSPFEKWFEDREESDREALLAAVVTGGFSIRELFDIVRAEHAPIGRDRFGDWLRANGYPG